LFVGVIHWFGNIWKMYFFRKGKSIALLLSFGLAGAVGSFIGARLIVEVSQDLLQRLLGLFLIIYCAFIYWKPATQLKQTPVTSSIGGLLSGISSGIFGVGGAVRGAFLTAFGLKKATYLFTAGAIGVLIDSTRLITYWQQGFTLSLLRFEWLLLGIPVSLLGAWLAKRLIEHVPQQFFRIMVVSGLLISGVYFLIR
jgi:uncharacterized membrane protein YfcA